MLLAKTHVLGGDLERASQILEEVLPEVERLGDSGLLVRTYYVLCMIRQMSGMFAEMERFSELCVAAAERSGNTDLALLASGARGNTLIALCEWEAAKEWYLDVAEIHRNTGCRQGLAVTLGNLGRVHMFLGEWSSADDCLERSSALARELASEYSLGLNSGNYALLQMRRGALGSAAASFGEAVVHAELAGDDLGLASVLSDLGELEHISRSDHAALEFFARSGELMDRSGAVDDLPALHRRKAESLMTLGRSEEARELARAALASAEEMGNPLEVANCLRVLGELSAADGKQDEAIGLLEDGIERLRTLGAPYELNQTLQVLGRVLLEAGRRDAAIERLTKARDGFRRLGARRDARRAQEELAAATGQVAPGPGRLPDERERLATLYASSHSLSSAASVEALIQDLADIAAAAVPADSVAVVLLSSEREPVVACSSLCDVLRDDSDILSVVSPALSELHEQEDSILTITADLATPVLAPALKAEGVRSLALVPLSAGERMVGALYLDYRTRDGNFSDEDIRFLRALARQAAILIENAQLRSKLTDEVESLRWVVDGRHKFASIVGQSLSMQRLFTTSGEGRTHLCDGTHRGGEWDGEGTGCARDPPQRSTQG